MTVSIGLGRVGSNFFTCSGLGWVGSHKMDPWTTLVLTRPCAPQSDALTTRLTATCSWVDRRARRTLCLLVDVDGSAGDDDKKVSQPARSAAESTSVSDLGPNLDRLWSYQCSTTRGRNVSCIGWNAANPVSIHCLLRASFFICGGGENPSPKKILQPPQTAAKLCSKSFFRPGQSITNISRKHSFNGQ